MCVSHTFGCVPAATAAVEAVTKMLEAEERRERQAKIKAEVRL